MICLVVLAAPAVAPGICREATPPSHCNSGLHSYGTGLQYHTGLIITYVYMCVYVYVCVCVCIYTCTDVIAFNTMMFRGICLEYACKIPHSHVAADTCIDMLIKY